MKGKNADSPQHVSKLKQCLALLCSIQICVFVDVFLLLNLTQSCTAKPTITQYVTYFPTCLQAPANCGKLIF